MATPFGLVAGTAAALFGLALGVLALLAQAADRWRKTALVGIATSSLALVVAAAEVVFAVLAEEWRCLGQCSGMTPERDG
jgi:hypothetical protein